MLTREVERQNVPYLEGGRQVRCDAYGIGLARLRDLRGGGHTRRHNADQRTWMAATEWAGGVAERELDSLLVSGLGAAEAQRWRDDGRQSATLAARARAATGDTPIERRQRSEARARRALDEARAGLVFDLRLSCRGTTALYEVKTVQYSTSSSGSWYRTRQLRAVDQRALRVLPERFRDARRVDDLLFPLHPQGPVLHRLHALGGVEPLVVGAFAERNQRAHRLVSELAEAAGPRVQRESAVDAQSAKGLAVWHLKRVLCCSAWSGLAQLQRERAHRFVLASTHAPGAVRPGTTHLGISTAASRPAAPPAPPPARARRRSASAARRGTCHGPLRRRRAEMRSQRSYCSCPHTPAADAKSVQSQCGCLRCGATAA